MSTLWAIQKFNDRLQSIFKDEDDETKNENMSSS